MLIGVTGGIASGKSTVAACLEQKGAYLVDADKISRQVVEPGRPAYEHIRTQFGPKVILPSGQIDRAFLAEIVFHDGRELERLNAIVHPYVYTEAMKQFVQIRSADAHAIIVYDVPLLIESGEDHPYDLIVLTQASVQTCVDRMVQFRQWSVEHAYARIRSQASMSERVARADVVIDTDCSTDELHHRIESLWQTIKSCSYLG